MQTITSTAGAHRRSIKLLLATVNLGRCTILAPSAASALWNRRIKLAPIKLSNSFTAYSIPYEWSLAPYCLLPNDEATPKLTAQVQAETPLPVLQHKLKVNLFTAFNKSAVTRNLFKQSGFKNGGFFNSHNRSSNLNPLVTRQAYSVLKHSVIKKSVLQKERFFNPQNGEQGSQNCPPAKPFPGAAGVKPWLAGKCFLSSQHVNKLVIASLVTPITNAVLPTKVTRANQPTTSTTGQQAIQSGLTNTDQFVQSLLKGWVQNTKSEPYGQIQKHARQYHQQTHRHSEQQQQQQQQQQKTLEMLEQQVKQANELSYRELQSLQRSLQEIKTLFGQQQKQSVAPRIKPPTFFGPL